MELVVGKFSEVTSDAEEAGLEFCTVAMPTGQDGAATLTGLFVVRQDDPAQSLEDLRGRKILVGAKDALERRWAAPAALEAFGLLISAVIPESPSCAEAALAVVEHEADAAVISSHAMPLLEGCGVIERRELRVVGRTDPAHSSGCS